MNSENKLSMRHVLLLIIAIIVGIGLFVVMPLVSSVIASTNQLNQQEVNITRLHNDISIEEEEIIEIQTEMKKVVQEYTNYEKESNELVVTNLDPTVVLNMYPDLKSNSMYNKLNKQYLVSMRKIKDTKSQYNNAVEGYNRSLVTVRNKILHGNREPKEFLK